MSSSPRGFKGGSRGGSSCRYVNKRIHFHLLTPEKDINVLTSCVCSLQFNGGPRICIGQQFALTEGSYVMVRLLQRFDQISARPEEFEGLVTSNLTLTSCPARPVTLKLHEAQR